MNGNLAGSEVMGRERPCPMCGYDLRAAVAGADGEVRCPECGKEVKGRVEASRIPWVHRRHKGRVKAYLQTVWMVVMRPRRFAEEIAWPVNVVEARRFHRMSIWLGAIIGTGFLGIAFMLRSDEMAYSLKPYMRLSLKQSVFAKPIYALTDNLWVLLLVGVSLYISLRLAMRIYRWFLSIKSGHVTKRQGVERVAFYVSGLVPVEAAMWGLFGIGLVVFNGHEEWVPGMWKVTLWCACLAFLLAAVVVFCWTTFGLIWRIERMRILRSLLMLSVYPCILGMVVCGIGLVVFWATGYVLVAIRSMTL